MRLVLPARAIKLLDWDQHLFLLLDAPAHPGAWLVQSVVVLADSPVIVVPSFLVALWTRGRAGASRALLAAAGQAFNQLPGLSWREPRLFMIPVGHTLMAHTADSGFPSDHATLVWTLGGGLLLTGAALAGSWPCVPIDCAVAWSRVWLGTHFPFDMLASAAFGAASGSLGRIGHPVIDAWVLPPLDRAYEGALPLLRLPAALILRRQRMQACTGRAVRPLNGGTARIWLLEGGRMRQPTMLRTQSRALALLAGNGDCRRSSTMADNSSPSWQASWVAAAVVSSTGRAFDRCSQMARPGSRLLACKALSMFWTSIYLKTGVASENHF